MFRDELEINTISAYVQYILVELCFKQPRLYAAFISCTIYFLILLTYSKILLIRKISHTIEIRYPIYYCYDVRSNTLHTSFTIGETYNEKTIQLLFHMHILKIIPCRMYVLYCIGVAMQECHFGGK